ncbi:hypothetical protein VSX64_25365 [Aurantimonas sp. C2-6-R+9]|uniref:hypothetical protein n=1 Tax=unclassified Aurantimonas TaxID=2638230 RepID=UPI002E17C2D6|nr:MULTISPECIES: hypothetical protein [unclassified Aurantimonas]MEC5293848.1 hypothetical protein [Aurantimonas sp. C2-3-R2]MEC5384011.1 hypothetical protein [Aurantimonas sp. C2-6-R+9]MEC5414901.1 hypothetical protein [Aurantimonas sp. C2-4-R8]
MIPPNGKLVAVADCATLKLFRNRGVEPDIDIVAVDEPKVAATNPGSGARHRNASANPGGHRSAGDGFAVARALQDESANPDGRAAQLNPGQGIR